MKEGGIGGANTQTGLKFERAVDFITMIVRIEGYSTVPNPRAGIDIFYKGERVAVSFKKHQFYKFLEQNRIDWKGILSKKLLPDDAVLVIMRDTLFIIEVKYQQGAGSVDEKLQTCDFKRKQYIKLVSPLGLRVEYVYVLNYWYRKPGYRDVLDYIHSVNCHYYFDVIPLRWFGLPDYGSNYEVNYGDSFSKYFV